MTYLKVLSFAVFPKSWNDCARFNLPNIYLLHIESARSRNCPLLFFPWCHNLEVSKHIEHSAKQCFLTWASLVTRAMYKDKGSMHKMLTSSASACSLILIILPTRMSIFCIKSSWEAWPILPAIQRASSNFIMHCLWLDRGIQEFKLIAKFNRCFLHESLHKWRLQTLFWRSLCSVSGRTDPFAQEPAITWFLHSSMPQQCCLREAFVAQVYAATLQYSQSALQSLRERIECHCRRLLALKPRSDHGKRKSWSLIMKGGPPVTSSSSAPASSSSHLAQMIERLLARFSVWP